MGPLCPKPLDRDVHQCRIDRRERGVVHAEALGHAGREVVDQHVGVRGKALHHLAALGALEVQRQRALAAITL